MELGTEQLANLLKKIKAKLTQQSLGHYREMAWMPFQKSLLPLPSLTTKINLDSLVCSFCTFFLGGGDGGPVCVRKLAT